MADANSTENIPSKPKNWPAVGMRGWMEGDWDNEDEPCLKDVAELECVIIADEAGSLYYVCLYSRIVPEKKDDWCNLRAHPLGANPLDDRFHPSPEAALRAVALNEEGYGNATLALAARLRGLADDVERRRP